MALGTVAELLATAAEVHGARAAAVGADGQILTYRELATNGRRLAGILAARGVERQARIALWMDDGPRYVEMYAACAFGAFVAVPISIRLTEHEAAHVLADSGAVALVYDRVVRERVAALDGTDLAFQRLEAGLDGWPDRLGPATPRGPATALGPEPSTEDVYVLGYTSGTTGAPKGAILTHRSVLAIARLNALSYRLPIGGVAAMTGSMSFVSVVPAHVISHLYVGGTVVFPGPWDVDSLSRVVQARRATFTYVPSPLIDDFAAAIGSHPERWTTLGTILHSASKASPERLLGLAQVVGSRLVEGWGMTENSGGLVTATTPLDITDALAGAGTLETVGRPAVESEVRVRAADGSWLPDDGQSIGELVVRTPALASGYWNRPDVTAFADGWYATGDLGSIDAAGYVRIAERRTDLIVSGGMNVYPSEVEAVIAEDPRVVACAVVGLPHPRWGQTVAAAIVPAPGAVVTPEEIVARCRSRLASYKKPTRVVMVDSLPMTPSMKVSRSAVRRQLEAG